jgi:hypothetical protein
MSLPKVAALGALAVVGGLFALLALMVWLTIRGPDAGVDVTNAVLTWVSIGGIVVVLSAVHLVYAKVLFDWARAPRRAMAEMAP